MKSQPAGRAPKSKSPKSKSSPRVRPTPTHRSFRLSNKRLKQHQPIAGVARLFKDAISVVGHNKKLFFGIAALNAVLALLFIQGLGSSFNIADFKQQIQEELSSEDVNQFGVAVTLFGYLVGTASSSANQVGGAYQIILTVITSLAVIWAVRQIKSGERPSFRDSFYKGMYPLIPFMLILLVIGLQLIPILIGNIIFNTVLQNGLAVTILEQIVWFLLFLLLGLLSFYMIISSFFSLYIVTLPDMTPVKALRSARELVLHRRFSITLKVLALPVVLSLISALIFIPMIIIFAPAVQILFLLTSAFSLVFIHIYMYLLYRSLI